MKTTDLHHKKTGLAVLSSFLLFISFNAAAQGGVNGVIPGAGSKKETAPANGGSGKSVYDVIPGSGPKKPSTTTKSGKSVYDVIPGSGPKKESSPNPVPDVNNRHDRRDDDGDHEHHRKDNDKEYNGKKKHLPPGQAKKIYGGSATDYAPGQVKKKNHGEKNHHHKKNEHHKHD